MNECLKNQKNPLTFWPELHFVDGLESLLPFPVFVNACFNLVVHFDLSNRTDGLENTAFLFDERLVHVPDFRVHLLV